MPRVYFKKGFQPNDLVNGVEFEVDEQEHSSDESDDFYDERFDELQGNDDQGSRKPLESNVPFDELKDHMTPITEDECVRKEIIKHGTGIIVPEKSVVIIHYDAFLDNETAPFDSTRCRNQPYKFLLGEGNVIPGLDLAILTMKKGEISRLLVTPEYAYGAMGCPPRIPCNARIMYVVELLNFFEGKDAVEFEEMTPDEQKKAPFEKIVAVFHCEHQVANDFFRSKHYKPAIARYRKMVRIFEDVSVADEKEDEQRNNYLMKLYLNLCLSYINIRNSQKAITYGHLALNLDENNPKAMYRLGCAYLLADEFDKAKSYLIKAKQYKPFESCVRKVLAELEEKRKQHEAWENMFCRRMFSSNTDNSEKTTVSEVKESPEVKEFRIILEKQFKKFLESDEKEFAFSSGYIDWQIDVVKELANEYNLAFVSKIHSDKKIIKVVKK